MHYVSLYLLYIILVISTYQLPSSGTVVAPFLTWDNIFVINYLKDEEFNVAKRHHTLGQNIATAGDHRIVFTS